MPKITVLLGAGASKDAGLPDAYELTRKVYEKLIQSKSDDAVLYAVVVAKLIARNAKNGQSPFDSINIEDVYDGLKRLLNRDQDILSEFVSGWDPISSHSNSPFDSEKFGRNLASIYKLSNRRSLDGQPRLSADGIIIHKIVEELKRSFRSESDRFKNTSLGPFVKILADILDVKDSNTEYMETFLRKHCDSVECIATLNYDNLLENSLEKIGRNADLGLTQWNEKRFVRFHGKSPKIIKLHGSTNWYIRNHDEIIIPEEKSQINPLIFTNRAIIFGGQSEKLVPYGPFLHLRHQFHQFLQSSSYLLVVGYSFRDLHLNALIRSWIATRKNGKIIIVDPSKFSGDSDVFRYARSRNADGSVINRVEIKSIQSGFANALNEIDIELLKRPNLSGK